MYHFTCIRRASMTPWFESITSLHMRHRIVTFHLFFIFFSSYPLLAPCTNNSSTALSNPNSMFLNDGSATSNIWAPSSFMRKIHHPIVFVNTSHSSLHPPPLKCGTQTINARMKQNWKQTKPRMSLLRSLRSPLSAWSLKCNWTHEIQTPHNAMSPSSPSMCCTIQIKSSVRWHIPYY